MDEWEEGVVEKDYSDHGNDVWAMLMYLCVIGVLVAIAFII